MAMPSHCFCDGLQLLEKVDVNGWVLSRPHAAVQDLFVAEVRSHELHELRLD